MTWKYQPGIFCRNLSWICSAVVTVVLLLGALWACGALWFDFPYSGQSPLVVSVFVVALVAVVIFMRPRWRVWLVIVVAIGLVLGWWLTLQPRQYRDWKPEVALSPYATIEGDIVTMHNVRNFIYRTEVDFTPRYEQRRLDLRKLRGMDMFITTWGSPYMAHPILSFDFGDDGRICFSIETRPERGEEYSALGGLYRRFELIYIVADERDVVRVRTNYRRGEDVYLYHINVRGPRQSFLEYVRTVNELHETPRWYNAITDNCTSAIRQQRSVDERMRWDWRMLVNGYGDELLYDKGAIDRSLPFVELKRRSHINQRAKAANDAPDFAARIRDGLPGMPVTP